jgi:hypothetical protein
MSPLDEQVEMAVEAIRSTGGQALITRDAPEEIKRAFLKMLWECPECRPLLQKRRLTH